MSVYVFLHNQYADWELGYILPELLSPPAVPEIKKNLRSVKTFSLDGSPLTSMGGLSVHPHCSLEQIDLSDVECLLLPGGTFWLDFENQQLEHLIKSVKKNGAPVGAICAATAYLGRVGLLNDIKHTSNSLEFLTSLAPDYAGSKYYQDELVFTDKGLVTASGLGALEFTYTFLKLLEVYEPPVLEVWFRAFKDGVIPAAYQS